MSLLCKSLMPNFLSGFLQPLGLCCQWRIPPGQELWGNCAIAILMHCRVPDWGGRGVKGKVVQPPEWVWWIWIWWWWLAVGIELEDKDKDWENNRAAVQMPWKCHTGNEEIIVFLFTYFCTYVLFANSFPKFAALLPHNCSAVYHLIPCHLQKIVQLLCICGAVHLNAIFSIAQFF